ncbi:MAG: ribosomal RNA small subunit methyltransferase A [Planctomycetota bacterium]|nr:ribosomal RNA small subunit methyltransferase A [Planctomycetota bacterium]
MARQTQSYLRSLFDARGLAPRRRYGQNFLIDLNLHEVIVKAAEVTAGDLVLEVGTGAGALTSLTASLGAHVVAVEVDEGMARLTRETLGAASEAKVLCCDVLAGKNKLNPLVVEALRGLLAEHPGRRLKLVANLPYNIATPLVANLLASDELRPERIVVTIQLELAERMKASPGDSAYGALSVMVQALADVEIERVLPPSVFWPRPQVDSAIVVIATRDEKRALIDDLAWFQSVTRRIFTQRRKNLRGVLHGLADGRLDKPAVDALLARLAIDGTSRAERLDVAQFRALATALQPILADFSQDPHAIDDDSEATHTLDDD